MKFIYKFLVTILVVLIILIVSKKSVSFKNMVYKNVYETNMSFSYLNTLYTKYFGSVLPFNLKIGVEPVFSEKLNYKSVSDYLDGCELKVDDNYLIPSLSEGLVIFEGVKEKLGNTIIVLDSNNIEYWYSFISNKVGIYDYIEKGSYIGDTNSKFLLTVKKNGDVLNCHDYI